MAPHGQVYPHAGEDWEVGGQGEGARDGQALAGAQPPVVAPRPVHEPAAVGRQDGPVEGQQVTEAGQPREGEAPPPQAVHIHILSWRGPNQQVVPVVGVVYGL